MIQLATDSVANANPYAAPQTLQFTGLPASPAEHKVMARIEWADVDNADATRTLHVYVVNTNNNQQYTNYYIEITSRDAGEPDHFVIGPMVIDASDGMEVSISSDNAADDNINITGFLFSDDLEYYLAWRAAEGSPTADSHTERIKTMDDLITEARMGALTDWINDGRLDVILDAIPSTGTGASSWTINVKVSGTAIDGAEVRITSDAAGNTTVTGPKYTDAAGDVDFLLDAGTYYAWISASGYTFSNPFTVTVT